MSTCPWKTIKSTWLTVYSGSEPSLLSPILADGSAHTSISVVRFEVGSPFLSMSIVILTPWNSSIHFNSFIPSLIYWISTTTHRYWPRLIYYNTPQFHNNLMTEWSVNKYTLGSIYFTNRQILAFAFAEQKGADRVMAVFRYNSQQRRSLIYFYIKELLNSEWIQ